MLRVLSLLRKRSAEEEEPYTISANQYVNENSFSEPASNPKNLPLQGKLRRQAKKLHIANTQKSRGERKKGRVAAKRSSFACGRFAKLHTKCLPEVNSTVARKS